jgi:enamine deaminase RidA (YjgF/YER057c/UK114 family)
VGAYSRATTAGELVVTAGHLPLTTDGEQLDDESIPEQTRQCRRAVEAIVESEDGSPEDLAETALVDVAETALADLAETTLADASRTTVLLEDIDDFEELDGPSGSSCRERFGVGRARRLERVRGRGLCRWWGRYPRLAVGPIDVQSRS